MINTIDKDDQEITNEESGITGSDKDTAMSILKEVGDEINGDSENFESVLILVKIRGRYLRYSSGVNNAMEDVGQLDVIKHDLIRRIVGGK
jgi:hypothetical protein